MKAYKETERKYYKYVNTKQPNVTTVGSPVITDGVISAITNKDYVTLPQTFTSSELTEAQIVFTTGSDITKAQGLFLGTISDNTSSLGIYNGGLYLINKVANAYPSYVSLGLPLEINTKYYFKFTQNGTSIIPYLSTDRETYNQGTSVTRSMNFGVFIGYGLSNDLTNTPMLGTIDLNESYIKINNELWWRGTIIETQQATQSDHDFYKDFDTYKLPGEVDIKYFKNIIEESVAGTYSVDITAGDYLIEMYGAGGGVSGYTSSGTYIIYGGGSGAGFKALVSLPAGTYNIVVGKGGTGRAIWNGAGTGDDGTSTTFESLITCGAGTKGQGTGGIVTLSDDLAIKELYKSQNGDDGKSAAVYASWTKLDSGFSTYDGTHYGYGAGGWWYGEGAGTATQNGLDGYIKIMQQTTADDSTTNEAIYTYYGIGD